jgi:hypothetical protein
MEQWYEIVQIGGSIQFSEEEDAIVWQYQSSGKYSMQSLYAIVNNRSKYLLLPCGRSVCPQDCMCFFGC